MLGINKNATRAEITRTTGFSLFLTSRFLSTRGSHFGSLAPVITGLNDGVYTLFIGLSKFVYGLIG